MSRTKGRSGPAASGMKAPDIGGALTMNPEAGVVEEENRVDHDRWQARVVSDRLFFVSLRFFDEMDMLLRYAFAIGCLLLTYLDKSTKEQSEHLPGFFLGLLAIQAVSMGNYSGFTFSGGLSWMWGALCANAIVVLFGWILTPTAYTQGEVIEPNVFALWFLIVVTVFIVVMMGSKTPWTISCLRNLGALVSYWYISVVNDNSNVLNNTDIWKVTYTQVISILFLVFFFLVPFFNFSRRQWGLGSANFNAGGADLTDAMGARRSTRIRGINMGGGIDLSSRKEQEDEQGIIAIKGKWLGFVPTPRFAITEVVLALNQLDVRIAGALHSVCDALLDSGAEDWVLDNNELSRVLATAEHVDIEANTLLQKLAAAGRWEPAWFHLPFIFRTDVAEMSSHLRDLLECAAMIRAAVEVFDMFDSYLKKIRFSQNMTVCGVEAGPKFTLKFKAAIMRLLRTVDGTIASRRHFDLYSSAQCCGGDGRPEYHDSPEDIFLSSKGVESSLREMIGDHFDGHGKDSRGSDDDGTDAGSHFHKHEKVDVYVTQLSFQTTIAWKILLCSIAIHRTTHTVLNARKRKNSFWWLIKQHAIRLFLWPTEYWIGIFAEVQSLRGAARSKNSCYRYFIHRYRRVIGALQASGAVGVAFLFLFVPYLRERYQEATMIVNTCVVTLNIDQPGFAWKYAIDSAAGTTIAIAGAYSLVALFPDSDAALLVGTLCFAVAGRYVGINPTHSRIANSFVNTVFIVLYKNPDSEPLLFADTVAYRAIAIGIGTMIATFFSLLWPVQARTTIRFRLAKNIAFYIRQVVNGSLKKIQTAHSHEKITNYHRRDPSPRNDEDAEFDDGDFYDDDDEIGDGPGTSTRSVGGVVSEDGTKYNEKDAAEHYDAYMSQRLAESTALVNRMHVLGAKCEKLLPEAMVEPEMGKGPFLEKTFRLVMRAHGDLVQVATTLWFMTSRTTKEAEELANLKMRGLEKRGARFGSVTNTAAYCAGPASVACKSFVEHSGSIVIAMDGDGDSNVNDNVDIDVDTVGSSASQDDDENDEDGGDGGGGGGGDGGDGDGGTGAKKSLRFAAGVGREEYIEPEVSSQVIAEEGIILEAFRVAVGNCFALINEKILAKRPTGRSAKFELNDGMLLNVESVLVNAVRRSRSPRLNALIAALRQLVAALLRMDEEVSRFVAIAESKKPAGYHFFKRSRMISHGSAREAAQESARV